MRLSLELLAVWLILDSVLNGATSWLQPLLSCSKFEGTSVSIVLMFFSSFDLSEYGLRPMCIND